MRFRLVVRLLVLALVAAPAVWWQLRPEAEREAFFDRIVNPRPTVERMARPLIEQLEDRSGSADRLRREIEGAGPLENRERILDRLEDRRRRIERLGIERSAAAILEILAKGCSDTDRYDLRRIVEFVLGPDYFDERTEQRIDAARTLGFIGDPIVVEPLVAVLSDRYEHRELRRTAAEALREIRDERAALALDELGGDRIGNGIGDPMLVDGRIAMLSNGDPAVRRRAIDELAAMNHPRSTDGLMVALDDPDPELRARTLRALEDRMDSRVYAAVWTFLQSELDPHVQYAALEVLDLMDGPRGVEFLIHRLTETSDPYQRGFCLERLAEIDDPRIMMPILRELRASGGVHSFSARQPLNTVVSRKRDFAVDPLIELLVSSRDPWLRGVVSDALTGITGMDFGMDIAAWVEWRQEREQVLPAESRLPSGKDLE